MANISFFFIVVIAGCLTAAQGPVNLQLGLNFTHNPVLPPIISFTTSGLILGLLALVRPFAGNDQKPINHTTPD